MIERPLLRTALSFALVLASVPAWAHTGSVAGGFVGGLAHPVFGPDHVVAMVAVGLWGAFLGPPAIWMLPIVFPLVMAFGGVLGILGVPIPAVETGIATSAVVLGLWSRWRRARRYGSRPRWSARLRSFTGTPTVPSFPPGWTRSRTRSDS